MTSLAELTAARHVNLNAKSFVRWAKAVAAVGGDSAQAAFELGAAWPTDPLIENIQKAAIAPAMTSDGSFASIDPLRPFADAYLGLVRSRTVLGRLPGVRSAPLNVSFPAQTGAASVGWIGENSVFRVTGAAFETASLPPRKIGGLAIFTRELARSSDPSAERIFERALTDAIVSFSDVALLDPTAAAVGDTSPASLTYGATSVTPSGTTAAAAKSDLAELIRGMTAAGCAFASPCWVMSPRMVMSLALMGIDPNLSLTGGSLIGVPVIPTTGAGTNDTNSPDSEQITLIDGAGITVSDGGIDVSASTQSSVQLADSPDSPVTASTVLVNLWERGLVGLMARRGINWTAAAGSVGFISGADYAA